MGRIGAVALVLLATASSAHATAIMPMDCVRVQSLVQQYGRLRAMAWAVEQIAIGTYSWRELRAAKRCLDAPKGKS